MRGEAGGKKDKAWIELLRREKVLNRGVNTVRLNKKKKTRRMQKSSPQTDHSSPVPARDTPHKSERGENINSPTKGGVRENAGVRSIFGDFSGTPHVCHVALDLTLLARLNWPVGNCATVFLQVHPRFKPNYLCSLFILSFFFLFHRCPYFPSSPSEYCLTF